MRTISTPHVLALALALASVPNASGADDNKPRGHGRPAVQVGVRPYYLVDQLSPGPLKDKLESCKDGPFFATDFSIGHRGGGTLQIPEHTKESHEAGARMGAGILECDVTFTEDGQLVCRHDQCDLHTTTDILLTPLADKCSKPFAPAEFDDAGERTAAASALCCTSDITLAEFKTLHGKMDASNPNALTPEAFQGGTATFRTDLYATGGTLLTHAESIALIAKLGAKYTPELKGSNRDAKLQVEDVFGSQAAYAQAMIDEYKAAGVAPKRVWAQSFTKEDVLYWVENEPEFGAQAVFLDDAELPEDVPSADELKGYYEAGIRIVAPPTWQLLTTKDGKIVPSEYAQNAKAAGLGIITWTLERSGRIVQEVLPTKDTDSPSFYYQSTLDALHNDGDILTTVDVLAQQVGVLGIFSDWSGTVSYYASCLNLP
jgi:glycerophosphoryl diester phosphodiesterase